MSTRRHQRRTNINRNRSNPRDERVLAATPSQRHSTIPLHVEAPQKPPLPTLQRKWLPKYRP